MRLTSSLMFSVEAVVQPPGSEQVVVRATLGNAAFVQHGDAVGLTDRRNAVRYDKDGDQHYDVASALIKSIRGSDVDAALHYLARMIEAGEDPRFIARRLIISASEDGLARPQSAMNGVPARNNMPVEAAP